MRMAMDHLRKCSNHLLGKSRQTRQQRQQQRQQTTVPFHPYQHHAMRHGHWIGISQHCSTKYSPSYLSIWHVSMGRAARLFGNYSRSIPMPHGLLVPVCSPYTWPVPTCPYPLRFGIQKNKSLVPTLSLPDCPLCWNTSCRSTRMAHRPVSWVVSRRMPC